VSLDGSWLLLSEKLDYHPQKTVQPGDKFEDTVLKPGFEIVEILNQFFQSQLFTSLWNTYHPWLSDIEHSDPVRWPQFDHQDPKMGVFLKSKQASPCGHSLEWKLTPKTPSADTMFLAAMAMVHPWKIVEDLQVSYKSTKLWPSLWKSVSCKKMGIKSIHRSCLKAWFKGYTFCFTTFLVRQSWSTAKPWTSPNKRSNGIERSKFRQLVQSFVCVPPWIRMTFKFLEMLKNALP
jgi:hypothetical protein